MTDVATAAPAGFEADPPAPVGRPRIRPSVATLVVLGLMAFSVFAHLAAFRQDLPMQSPDEEFFVSPAVHMAASGDFNPHWFGHPGSTVIYPVAAAIHVWDAALHGGPVFGSHAVLEARFDRDPTPFYLIGRIWALMLAIATIPMLYALGRRCFDTRVGLIAATLWTALPYAIHHDRIARTDSAATFFSVVALYFCMRAWQDPRRRWWVLAGVGVGLAVASRYFMVTLVPWLVVAAVVPLRTERRRAVVAAATALVVSAAAFVLSTPYALLDLSTVRKDISAEANLPHVYGSGLSPIGNAEFYVRTAIPGSVTWVLYVVALLGIAVILWRRRGQELMLVGFVATFLVAISTSSLHWQRWLVPLLPIFALFAAVAVSTATTALAARLPTVRWVGVVTPVVVTLALALVPLADLPDTNRYDAAPSTYSQARNWLRDNLPPGSRVVQPPSLFNRPVPSIAPVGRGIQVDYHLDPRKSLSEYRRAGVGYVATSPGDVFRGLLAGDRHPREAAFYGELACKTRLVALFPSSDVRFGGEVSIYRLDQAPVEGSGAGCLQRAPNRTR